LKKNTITTILLITLAITFTFASLLPHVKATDVEITSISPETHRGKVGEEVRITGTINTTDGLYRILFDNIEVNETYAIGNKVDATFPVPQLPKGNYTIMLQDVDADVNATTWFYIETTYYLRTITPAHPEQLQEDSTVEIWVNVTGGESNTIYYANITVNVPTPANETYWTLVKLTNTTNTGEGYNITAYPNGFHGAAHTNYTGTYTVAFNQTLATSTFRIGLTNATEYHREEFVGIRAVGYQPNETATITITFLKTNKTLPPIVVNASEQGIINSTWIVPWNALIGDYNMTITPKNMTKPIRDSQIFSIPGYQIDICTRNLAGDAVPQILVEALDNATNTRYNKTSEKDGLARLWLERGNHIVEAFWKKVKVNATQVTITGKDTYDLTCKLTNVKITVKDKDGSEMPFVQLNISYQYVTTKENEMENGSATGETDIFGVFCLNSTLPHINYTIDASRYGIVFNTNNNTIKDLPPEKWFNVAILCPAKTLTLNITESHRTPLPNARIEVIEQMGGISYNETTNDVGIATINCTFGKYQLKVYIGNVFLNGTFIEMFNDTCIEIYCKLYNLTVSVKIVDYFGQPIPNANVTLQRNGSQNSSLTKSNGMATFSNIIGGDLQMMVYLPGQSQPCVETTSSVDESTTIEIKIGKYVIIAGFLVETAQLTTAIIIVAAIILILLIEIYRRKRLKPQKTSS